MTRPPLPSTWRVQFVSGMRARAIGKIETAPNRGQLVDYVQKRAGGDLGEFWCADAGSSTAADMLGKSSPIILSGSCAQQRVRAKKLGALRTRAEFDAARTADPLSVLGWIVLVINTSAEPMPIEKAAGLSGHGHHFGVIGEIDDATGELVVNAAHGGFYTIEGNAADPRKPASRDGDGWYHGRERGHPDDHATYEFVDLEAFPL